MYKEGLKYTHVNQDDMCTYTNKTEMDTLAWIKHKCTHVQLQKEIHKCFMNNCLSWFFFFWLFNCLSFFDLRLLILPMVPCPIWTFVAIWLFEWVNFISQKKKRVTNVVPYFYFFIMVAVSFRSFQLHRDYSVCKQFRNFIENNKEDCKYMHLILYYPMTYVVTISIAWTFSHILLFIPLN
jgi:hypothetical protein